MAYIFSVLVTLYFCFKEEYHNSIKLTIHAFCRLAFLVYYLYQSIQQYQILVAIVNVMVSGRLLLLLQRKWNSSAVRTSGFIGFVAAVASRRFV